MRAGDREGNGEADDRERKMGHVGDICRGRWEFVGDIEGDGEQVGDGEEDGSTWEI